MSDNQVAFFAQAALLDQFIHNSNPEADADTALVIVQVLLNHLDLRRYFFQNRPDPGWLPLLHDHGFFDEPPPPVQTGQGLMLPVWDVQDYLASVSSEAPQFVVKHIENIVGHPVYISRAIRCMLGPSYSTVALAIPLEDVKRIIPRLLQWLAEYSVGCQIADDVWDVTRLLAEARDEDALLLFSALMRPFPNPQCVRIQDHPYNDEAISLVRDSQYEQDKVQELVRLLQAIGSLDVVHVLEEQLLLSLQVEADVAGSEISPSTWWRPAIEPSGQNYHHYYKDNLLDFLRDAAEAYAAQHPFESPKLIQRYLNESGSGIVLRRLGLHLLRLFAESHLDLLAQELLNEINYNDAACHHEFLRLLEDGYSSLPAEARKDIVTTILNGPPPDEVERMAECASEDGALAKQEYTDGYRRHWTKTRLWMIKDHLTENDAEVLQAIIAEHGEPQHPTHLTWSSGTFHVAQVSPLTLEQITELTPVQLLGYLQEWQPADRPLGPEEITREGLGQVVAAAALADLPAYSVVLSEVCATHPDYAWRVLWQASERGKDGKFTWEENNILLGVCEELLQRPDIAEAMTRTSRSSWRDVRQQIIQVLDQVLEAEEDARQLARVRDLLIGLCDDPDPDLESDRPKAGWVGHGDPQSVAINHVRPSSLASLIIYAHKCAGFRDDGPGPTRIEPVVLKVLTQKLQDESLAVRSVYGRYLMLLYWLDKSWLEAHLEDIFPKENDELSLWKYTAAWDSYVIFNQSLNPKLFAQLHSYYVRAIEILRLGYTTKTHLQPVRGLAAHLIYDFIQQSRSGQVPRSGTLLYALMDSASGEERGQIAWMMWRQLKDESEKDKQEKVEWDTSKGDRKDPTNFKNEVSLINSELWPIARTLWQSRLEEAASQNFPADFDKEVGWFTALLEFIPGEETIESLWPLLQMTLPYVSSTGYRHQTWEALETFLVQQVHRDPKRVIEFYTQMYEHVPERIWKDTAARKILSATVVMPVTRDLALTLIDSIARKGDLRFKDIYDRYAS